MPKMKTHRGAAKRFRVTGGGKVLHRKATGNHMLIKKSSSRKRRITGMAEVKAEDGTVRRMLGGSRSRASKRSPAP
ncbi:MAG TPA: 50S ribosomal protein L35 [Actinomycetota bacterium]|nr:50S ribosomal protein L35 [Actinomycetota bacterium]